MGKKYTKLKISSFFLLGYFSFLGLLATNNLDTNKNSLIKDVRADDDYDDEEDDDKDEEDDDDEYLNLINNLINSNQAEINTSTGKTNCKTVYNTIYDTITSASGKTSKVAKKVASEVCDTGSTIVEINSGKTIEVNSKNLETTNEIKKTTSTLFKAPNSKVYSIIDENGIFSIKKSDGTYAKKTFNTQIEAENYLKQNAVPAPESYKAPNGNIYTIMFENAKVVIKKSDWSYAKQSFDTYAEAKTYLDKNAPKKVIKKVVNTTKKTTTLNTNITKKTINPVKTTPKPVVKTPVLKPDTTTKAS